LPYVRQQPNTQLPSCLLPEPLAPVRTALPEEPIVPPRGRTEIEELVHRLAPQYSIDSQLVLAVISAESSFNPTAVSPKNAQGLMQLIPETAARFGVKKVLNPVENIKGGLAYLRWLLAYFKGDVTLDVAAYNAGERAVERYRGVPPYAETRAYVERIRKIFHYDSHPYDGSVTEPSPVLTRTP
jgi:soluble lytic murein transglycosylase-like protein